MLFANGLAAANRIGDAEPTAAPNTEANPLLNLRQPMLAVKGVVSLLCWQYRRVLRIILFAKKGCAPLAPLSHPPCSFRSRSVLASCPKIELSHGASQRL